MSTDELTGVQALERKHAGLPLAPGKVERREFEYIRHGTRAFIVSRDVVTGELHKDPVCGMYVAESTRFQRKSGREHFYYCSEECKDKHAVAAR